MNKLYYGDNLGVLRDGKNFPDECVDLIYLDPPCNSKRGKVSQQVTKQKRAFRQAKPQP